jgi:putative transposon-encoded protein
MRMQSIASPLIWLLSNHSKASSRFASGLFVIFKIRTQLGIGTQNLSDKEINIYYVHTTSIIMVRRMIATITLIESVVTPSGNSGHVVVPKAWIGKEAIVVLKESKSKRKG